MRFNLVLIFTLLTVTGCLDTDGKVEGAATSGSTGIDAGDIADGVLPIGVVIGDVSQLPSPLDGSACAASEILEWNGTQWTCIPTPTVAGGAATTVPAGGVLAGTIGAGVLLPSNQITGRLNPVTQLDGTVCPAGTILESDGTNFSCVVPSTVATSVPATGITAGTIGAGVLLPSTQITGTINPNTQIGAGALAGGITLATSQLTGGINPATQIAAGNLPVGVNLSNISQLPAPFNGTGCATNEILQRIVGGWACIAIPGGTDNLGNHIATTNIQLGSNYLSGDGDNEGVFVDAAGNVGIGTSVPTGKLDVIVGGGSVRLRSESFLRPKIDILGSIDSNAAAMINLFSTSQAGTIAGFRSLERRNYHTTTAGTNVVTSKVQGNLDATGATINDMSGSLSFYTKSTGAPIASNRLYISPDGNVGIGTTTPRSTLDIAGSVQIANDVSACDATKAGAIRYNGGVVEYCDSSSWTAFGTAAGGEVNTASNIGVSGVGMFSVKSGVQLQFKNINNASSKISVSDDVINNEVDIDVVEANVDHDALLNFVGNEHVDHSSVSVLAGTGLTGGGTIATTRTLNVNVGTGANQIVQLNGASRLPAVDGSLLTNLPSAPVTSVFGRVGVVIPFAGDYTAAQITNVAAGSIVAITTQAAINELDAEKLSLTGGTMSGVLAMGTSRITGLGEPTSAQDAATRNYVDVAIAAVPGGADNLGNHTATTNLNLANNLLVGNGGTAGVAVSASGNVGIGTTSPGERLSLESAGSSRVSIKDTGNTTTKIIFDANRSAGNQGLGLLEANWNGTIVAEIGFMSGDDSTNKDNGEIRFRTSESGVISEQMRIDKDGNVGIGTSSPATELHVDGTSRFERDENNNGIRDAVRIFRTRADATAPGAGFGGRLSFYGEGFTDGMTTSMGDIGVLWEENQTDDTTTRNSAMIFRTKTADISSEQMRIDAVGNVGIGTATPTHLTHVKKDFDGEVALVVENASPGVNAYPALALTNDTAASYLFFPSSNFSNIPLRNNMVLQASSGSSGLILDAKGTNSIKFFTGATVERMRVDAGGNVGIGTASPGAKLDVAGQAIFRSMSSQIILKETDNPTDVLDAWHLSMNGENLTTYYEDNSAGPSYLAVLTQTKAGNVGIGTINPGTELHMYKGSLGVGVTDFLTIEGNRGDFGVDPAGVAILFKDQDTNNSTNEARIKMMTVNDTDYGDNDEAASNLIFETTNAGIASDKMIITGRGDVGIGTINPAVELDVNLGVINASAICDENNSNCIDLSAGLSNGTVTSVATGTGLTGGTITGSGTISIAAGGVGNAQLAGSAVTGAKIAANTILAGDIAADAVGASELANDSVASANIIVDSILAVDIAAGAVGNSELAGNSVTGAKIAANTIFAGDIGANAIGSSELANSSVDNASIINGTINALTKLSNVCTSGLILKSNGSGFVCSTDNAGSGADNLGNHSATQNIRLNGRYLSGDGGNEGVSVTSAGNVGVGILSPSSKFHVVGSNVRFTSGTRGIHMRTDTSNSYINNMNGFVSNGSSSNGTLVITGQTGVSLRYGSSGSSGTEALKVTSSGRVGIGTGSPTGRFEVVDGNSDFRLAAESGISVVRVTNNAANSISAIILENDAISGQMRMDSDDNLKFQIAGVTRMTLKSSNGGFGI